jgi:hypothetical protein
LLSQTSSENARNGFAKRLLIDRIERTELAYHQGLLEGGKDRLDNGWFEKPRSFPASNPDFVRAGAGAVAK